nr:hypothetical protein Iba_chr04bCG7830 [Ipomoea batatas]GMC90175.1 hypothetical protein Iba_chr04fCG5620 [Ipomoea batatas]
MVAFLMVLGNQLTMVLLFFPRLTWTFLEVLSILVREPILKK